MDAKQLRREFQAAPFRRVMIAELGTICVNCGSDLDIEYHHIVPLAAGGTNRLSNIAPLCAVCHAKAHQKLLISGRGNMGRPAKAKLDENTLPILHRFFAQEIGQREAMMLLGMCQDAFIKLKKLYAKEYSVPDGFYNHVDIRSAAKGERIA